MAGIKQTVPNYIFGASNQPDQLKIPGFVNEAINIYPDVTEGCEKRPGSRHISTLTGVGTAERTWFALDHGGDDHFIGRVDGNGNVRIWECDTGTERTTREIDNSRTYLRHNNPEDIQVLTINDRTYIVNRSVNTAMDHSGATTAPAQENKAFVDLSAIAYGKQYALDITLDDFEQVPITTTRVTKLSIEWDPGGDKRFVSENPNDRNVDEDDSCKYNTREIRTINAAGSTRAAQQPARFADGDMVNHPGRNLRFEVSMIGTPYIANYTGGPDDDQANYWCRYDINIDLLHGGEGWTVGTTFIIEIGAEGSAAATSNHRLTVEEVEEIEVNGNWLIRPEPTPHTGSHVLTAEKILTDLRTEIIRHNPAFIVERIGNGLLITEPDRAFTVTTTEGNLMNIINRDVSSAANLPSQCEEGYVVKVSNSTLDEDDYYLKFTGESTWVETVAPESRNHILPQTMPHQIVRNTNGTFDVEPVVWEDRLAGDDETNPKPTFLRAFDEGVSGIGSPISNLLFWRNRLVLLSKNNVCLTQPITTEGSQDVGNPVFNVWGKSAIALSPKDAIDIIATSNHVCNLKHGIEVNAGLMLFSEYEQFLLTTDSDVVTPETVKVKRVSSWSCSERSSPISLGNSIAFCDDAGRHSRLFEMSNITRETEPLVTELSKPITKSIPTGIRSIAESRENGLVVLAHHSPYSAENPDPWSANQGLSTVRTFGAIEDCQNPYNFVYCYKYFNSGNKRIQSAWFKWKFSGRVLWHTIIRDTYYFILDNNLIDVRLQAMDLVRKDSGFLNPNALTEKCGPEKIHLDGMVDVTGTGTFDGTRTRFPIPASLIEWGILANTSVGSFRGLWSIVWFADDLQEVAAISFVQNMNNSGFTVEGDITSSTSTVLGFEYDMILKLPEIYPTKKVGDSYIADTTSALTVHRCKFNLGLSGPIDIRVRSKDRRSDWSPEARISAFSQYTHDDENAYGVLSSQQVDVPIYQTNTNFKLEFYNSGAMPCTLNSMTWEGDYNTLYRSA